MLSPASSGPPGKRAGSNQVGAEGMGDGEEAGAGDGAPPDSPEN